jgi:hypothetical protein
MPPKTRKTQPEAKDKAPERSKDAPLEMDENAVNRFLAYLDQVLRRAKKRRTGSGDK